LVRKFLKNSWDDALKQKPRDFHHRGFGKQSKNLHFTFQNPQYHTQSLYWLVYN